MSAKEYARWTDEMKMSLATMASKKEGYLKTSISMADKWKTIHSKLKELPMFEDKLSNLIAWDIPTRAINLPSYHDINEAEINRVCNVIKSFL